MPGTGLFIELLLFSLYIHYSLVWLSKQMAQTPLHVSAGYNNVEIVKFLLGWQEPEKVELEAKNMVGKISQLSQHHWAHFA